MTLVGMMVVVMIVVGYGDKSGLDLFSLFFLFLALVSSGIGPAVGVCCYCGRLFLLCCCLFLLL